MKMCFFLFLSPTKTLQQKLAEKQKENQSRISLDRNSAPRNSPIPKSVSNFAINSVPTTSTFMKEFGKQMHNFLFFFKFYFI